MSVESKPMNCMLKSTKIADPTHFPAQATGEQDQIAMIQIEKYFLVCTHELSEWIGYPVAAQFTKDGTTTIFGLRLEDREIR